MHRLLHLQKHAHTGKVISHRHTSYRSLFVIVALLSLGLAGLQQAAGADEIVISAKVAAPIPTVPPVITSPLQSSVTHSAVINVTGSCQIITPAIIIVIQSPHGLLGSTTCSSTGTFSILITLLKGANKLTARVVNITGDYGPSSTEVTLTYVPNDTVASSNEIVADGVTPTAPSKDTAIAAEGSATSPLKILSKYSYLVYGPDKPANWVGLFEGGVAPYFMAIDWGDGLTTTHRNIDTTEQSIEHRYKAYTSYFVKVTVTDSQGRSLQQQLAAVTPYVPQIGTTTTRTDFGGALIIDPKILTIAIYASTAALIGLGVLGLRTTHSVAEMGGAHAARHATKKTLKSTNRKHG